MSLIIAMFLRRSKNTEKVTFIKVITNARISYAAAWFDGIDRSIAAANYGAIASFTRPDTPPASSSTGKILRGHHSN